MIVNMKEMLTKANAGHYAIPAINTQGGSYDITWAICKAAEEMNSAIILAHYDSCSPYAGLDYFVEISRWCANKVNVPVAIHLDHGASVDLCKKAIDLGCTSVMYDGSALSIEENARNTNEVLAYAASRDVSVEAEIGRLFRNDLATVEEVQKSYADVEEVKQFLSITTPDALALAIGNAHGFYMENPELHFEVLDQVREFSNVPFVLHGGTGIAINDVQKTISKGVTKVNIGTDVRCNYVKYISEAIEKMGLQEHAWKIQVNATERLTEDVKHYIKMCGSINKA